ncbi:putative NRPS-like enzyme [Aspergillus undulatus]|uniref:putative NRPS-like enzyme n=1 Tax=Aspergillus undulatus TaxID=1810928 RepID=UPI003CCC9113
MASTLVAQTGVQLSTAADYIESGRGDPVRAGRKRKTSESSASKANAPRQKITRACDSCKEKKTRCTGTLPCGRCTRLSLPCEYNAAYSRGLPPEPLPAPPSVAARYSRNRSASHASISQSPISHRSPPVRDSHRTTTRTPRSQISQASVETPPRRSPDPVATDFEGNYLGPASGVFFLNRVWRRLHQDETSAVPGQVQDEWGPKNTSVFMHGDKPYADYRDAGFALPPFEKALELVSRYFDYAMVTYRFLHRGSVEEWLRQVYSHNISLSNLPTGPLVARTSIILMIFAGNQAESSSESERWYAASKHMLTMEVGPPRLETVQARLGQCLYLLSSSRANECWYTFGTAVQLVTAIGLHRRCAPKLSKKGITYLERELRKRILWSAYTLDKYLNVIFGRPRLLHDVDIDQEFPDEVNDEDILQDDPAMRLGTADSMMIASVLHFRLGRILGDISRQFYTVNPMWREAPLEAAVRITSDLEKWKETTPPLFNSVRPTSLIPPLCRQSQVLQLAYCHAMIHATRSFLLNDFTDLGRRPEAPHPAVTVYVTKCLDAAEQVLKLVDSIAKQGTLIQSFWFTHHHHRHSSTLEPAELDTNRVRSLFSLAEVCQQHLAEATRKNCPSRRYGIILEETRVEVHKQLGSQFIESSASLGNAPEHSRDEVLRDRDPPLEQRTIDSADTNNVVPFTSNTIGYEGMPSAFVDEPFDMSDFGILDNLEGSIWWTQLDTWMLSTLLPQAPTTHIDKLPRHKEELPAPEKEPLTVDELVRHRASLGSSQPVVYYPRTGIEYSEFPLQQLDTFAFRVAKELAERIRPRKTSSEAPTVVALLGPSDLNYLVLLLAVTKLGHAGLLLSTRISVEAHVSLIGKTNAQHIFVHASLKDTAEKVKERVPELQVHDIPSEESYDYLIPDEPIDTNLLSHLDPEVEAKHLAWIIHSSGSTGLPKPIFQTQRAAVKNYAGNMNMRGLITLPLYHNHGICCLFRTIYSCKTLHLYNPGLPLTSQYLVDIMRSYSFEIFYGVPYALKLLAESKEGIAALADLKAVMFGGSPCPDSLGNLLVENGVNLIAHYGSTETGQLMTSVRPRDDKTWDWLRPSAAVKKFLRMEERYPGVYESVVLDGWPSKVMSNRPDGAYATKDLFLKHPEMEAYKYYSRLDDTITLVNGEKVIPLDLEGRVRQLGVVADALVFGVGKSSIGLAVFRAPDAAYLADDEIVKAIWPAVEQANEILPAYGQLSKDMVRVLPPDTPYARTDKGTVIRQAFYRDFADLIEASYEAEDDMTGTLLLSEVELKVFLKKEIPAILPIKDERDLTDDADFFSLGMDSLQATQLRSVLIKSLDTNGQKLGLNVAFEHPTVASLASYLYSLSSGTSQAEVSIEEQMQVLIEKYSDFDTHVPRPNGLGGRYIVVTGATGSLGAHVVSKLSSLPGVQKVYCFVRASSPLDAYGRLLSSLRARRVYETLSTSAKNKLIALPSDLSDERLGLDNTTYNTLISELTDVIHCAWSVNFNLHLSSFEKDNIAGLRNLTNLCLRAHRPAPATFNFCSSISAVVRSPHDTIPESLPERLEYAQDMGYAQSKLVAENICVNAAQKAGIQSRVLRIGQVVGDSTHGIWNTTEAIPLMIQAARTIGALPKLDEWHRWLPVDVIAGAVVDVSLSNFNPEFQTESQIENEREVQDQLIYNIISPHPFHWTRDLLPLLRDAGLSFEEVPQQAWIQKLRESNPDPVKNPPIKLVDFFAGKYDNDLPRRAVGWESERTKRVSRTFEGAKGVEGSLVGRMMGFFLGKDGWGK